MKDIFKDVLGIEGIHGVVALNAEGATIMSRFLSAYKGEEAAAGQFDWNGLTTDLGDVQEAEFIFERHRIYIRKHQTGSMVIAFMDDIAPISMVRLNCEVLLPALDRAKPVSAKIGQILKKKIF